MLFRAELRVCGLPIKLDSKKEFGYLTYVKKAILFISFSFIIGLSSLFSGEFSKTTLKLGEVDPKVIDRVEMIRGAKLDADKVLVKKYVIEFGSKNWVDIKTRGLGVKRDSQFSSRVAKVVLFVIQENAGKSPCRVFYDISGNNGATGGYLFFKPVVPLKVEANMIGAKFMLAAHANDKGESLYGIILEQTSVRR